MLYKFPFKIENIQKVLLLATLYSTCAISSSLWASTLGDGFKDGSKPFGALWDRLTARAYPLEDVTIASWKAGYWQEPGISGYYQLVLTETANRSNRLYVQWLFMNPQGEHEIAYSMSVTDVNEMGQYFIERPACGLVADCDALRVQVTHRYENTAFGLNLNIEGLGHYRLKVEYF